VNKEPLLFCTPGGNETVLLSSRLFPTRLPVCVALHLALVFFYFKQIRQTTCYTKAWKWRGTSKARADISDPVRTSQYDADRPFFFLCEYTHLLLNDTTVAQWTLALVAFLTTSFSYCKIIECLPLIVSVFNSHDRWLFFSKRCAFSPLKKKDKGEMLNNFFF
jgi:hypothetical protein